MSSALFKAIIFAAVAASLAGCSSPPESNPANQPQLSKDPNAVAADIAKANAPRPTIDPNAPKVARPN